MAAQQSGPAPPVTPGSFGRLVVTVAAVCICLAGMHFAAEVVLPVCLAVVLALILAPLEGWLRGRGVPHWGAVIGILLGVIVGSIAFGLFFASSIASLRSQLSVYAASWTAQLDAFQSTLASLGVEPVSLSGSLSADRIAGFLGALLGFVLGAVSQVFLILFLLGFFLAEGGALVGRLRRALGPDSRLAMQLIGYGSDVSRYFVLRTMVNAVTGALVAVVLALLGVDFPVLWGVLTFFLSYIPYIGMFLASVPSVLLAWAEFDIVRALVVIVALTVVNASAENLLQPALMSRGLQLSPTFVFLSVFFWSWLLGGSGSFLAVPLSLGAIAILGSFASTRWLAQVVITRRSE